MEAYWENLLQAAQSRDDKVLFIELQNLVQTARHAVENLPPCWDKGVTVPDTSDDRATLNDAACAIDDSPTTEEWERTTSDGHGAVTIMYQGESNIATPRGTTQIHPAINPPNTRLDEDERVSLQRITETFESVRSNMATAWNKAMIQMDDEVVFAKLNAMLSVSKDAADKVIQAALRAYKKAAARLNNLQAGSGFAYTTDEEDFSPARQSTTPENDRPWQQQIRQESVKRSDKERPYQTHSQPLPARDGGLSPVRRVHERGADPQPNVEESFPPRTNVKQPVIIKNQVAASRTLPKQSKPDWQ